MNTKILLIFLLLIIASMNTASADEVWVLNTSVKSGLTDMGTYSTPTIFLDGSTLKLISGEGDGGFYGWYWNGTSWVSDSSIVSGLGNIGFNSNPFVYFHEGSFKLISGNSVGAFYGWYWSGSAWVSDTSIVTGLPTYGTDKYAAPTVFYDGSTLTLIAGIYRGISIDNYIHGFYWNGTSWVQDSAIVAGIGETTSIWAPEPNVFLHEGTIKMILGNFMGDFYGFYWNGSVWMSDSSIVAELGDVGDTMSSPAVFNLSGLKLISGQREFRWLGWYWEPEYVAPTPTPTPTSTPAPTVIPVIAPPSIVPTEEPTPFVEVQREETIFEEIMTEIENFTFEKVIIFIGKALSWAFILTSYIGALASYVLIKGKEENEESDVFNILLFGTVGWVLLLLINTTGYIAIVTPNFILNSLIFGIAGFAVYILLDMLSSKD